MQIAHFGWQDNVLGNNGDNIAASASSEKQCTDPTLTPGPSTGESHLIDTVNQYYVKEIWSESSKFT